MVDEYTQELLKSNLADFLNAFINNETKKELLPCNLQYPVQELAIDYHTFLCENGRDLPQGAKESLMGKLEGLTSSGVMTLSEFEQTMLSMIGGLN